jgi:spermidine synthase
MKIDKPLIYSVFSLGFTTIITQIILLREFLAVFYGNELVIGIILANWMILTGIGAFLGKYFGYRKISEKNLIFSFFAQGIFPIMTVFLLDYLRNIVFTSGSMVNLVQILYSSFILLFPFCIVSGFTFIFLTSLISFNNKSNLISKVYALESVGSLIGGLISSFLMIFFLKTYQSLTILLILNLLFSVYLSYKFGGIIIRFLLIVITFVSFVAVFNFNLDNISKKYLFQNQEILYYKDTPYGNLTITRQGEQKNFYENNVLLFSTGDPISNEESVHYAMIQNDSPKTVLLIGGGISGTINEILKYNINKIDYVEINPWIISVGKTYADLLSDKRINIVIDDARLFIKNTYQRYDVVLINLPEPITAQLNRFYTIEFFSEIKSKLNKNAVISLSLLTSTDYISPEVKKINSIIFNSLGKVFKNILIIPGMKNYFIASDKKLNVNIGKMIDQRGIENLYVNKYYLDDNLLRERSNYLKSNLIEKTNTNKDFYPVSYYRLIIHWLNYFDLNYWIPVLILIAGFTFFIIKLNAVSFGIFCGGFAASSIEIVLLISFQVIYGFVYNTIGIIITIFMAGLTVGSYFWNKIFSNSRLENFIKIQFYISIYSLTLPLFLVLLKYNSLPVLIVHLAFFLLIFIISFLVGLEFSLASKIERGNISSITSKIYSADLIGSAFGALLVSTFFIPVLGLIQVSIITGLLNFVSSIITFKSRTSTN